MLLLVIPGSKYQDCELGYKSTTIKFYMKFDNFQC